jgi:hypothetical protein
MALRHTDGVTTGIPMSGTGCLIHDCSVKTYAPAGTGALCKEHFLSFVTWRRRKGPQMFYKYGAMSMEERATLVTDWQKTVTVE